MSNKIGTHNSLSYLPCQWYLRLFSWIGKCQNKNIEKQYKSGVRYFDIRIKFNKENKPISGHGLLTYNIDIYSILDYLNNQDEKVIVRLFLENKKKNPKEHKKLFQDLINEIVPKYTNIRFVEGGCRYDYERFIDDNLNVRVCYAEYYKMKFCIPFPIFWALRHNKSLHELDNENEFSIYDFFNY